MNPKATLATDRSHWRGVARDLSTLTVTTLLGVLFAFLVQMLFVRALPPHDYGVLSTALAAITLASPLAGLGVGKYWLRVFGVEGWSAVRWIGPSVWLSAIGLMGAFVSLLSWTLLAAIDPTISAVTLLLLPTVAIYPLTEMVFARLQLEERYRALSLWQLAPNAARLLVAIVTVVFGLALGDVALSLTLALLALSLLLAGSVAGLIQGRLALVGHGQVRTSEAVVQTGWLDQPVGDRATSAITAVKPGLGAVLKGAWPFAASGVFYLVYYQSDVLLLGWLDGPAAAGFYNVAFAVMAAVFLLPSVLHQKYLLPKMHRWAEHDRQRFLAVFRFGNGATLLLGVVVAVGVFLVGPSAVTLLFGADYAAAGSLLAVLALSIPGRYLATSVGAVLVTQDNMRRKVWLMALTAMTNLVLNLWLIPRFGAIGAAWATVASETVLVAAYLLAVRRFVFGADAFAGWTILPPGKP